MKKKTRKRLPKKGGGLARSADEPGPLDLGSLPNETQLRYSVQKGRVYHFKYSAYGEWVVSKPYKKSTYGWVLSNDDNNLEGLLCQVRWLNEMFIEDVRNFKKVRPINKLSVLYKGWEETPENKKLVDNMLYGSIEAGRGISAESGSYFLFLLQHSLILASMLNPTVAKDNEELITLKLRQINNAASDINDKLEVKKAILDTFK